MLTFYPTLSCGELGKYADRVERMLLPVSSWAGYRLREQRDKGLTTDEVIGNITVPKIPAYTKEIAADCGGFVATLKWGTYRYSIEQYVRWLEQLGPKLSWAATMDYCCEPDVGGIVKERQDKTTEKANYFWQHYNR